MKFEMSNGEGTSEVTSEVTSPDRFDSFNSLRIRQSDDADASLPSSRYSSCGESEFDRYCSANSVMGTPSMCSTVTVFHDFGFGDDSGLEDFSLEERAEISHQDQKLSTSGVSDNSTRVFSSGCRRENNHNQQNLEYGSSGLELYDDDNDELTMNMLDTSSLMGVNQIDEHLRQDCVQTDHVEKHNDLGEPRDDVENQSSGGNEDAGTTERYLLGDVDGKCSQSVQAVGEGGVSCALGREDELYGFDTQSGLQIVEREVEREEHGCSSNFEHSEGEDSMYNYGSDNDIKNEFHLARNIHYRQESKVQNENPLLMNSSTAFGSEDLDDLLLENKQNAQASHTFNIFSNQNEKNPEVEDNQTKLNHVNSMKFSSPGQKEGGKDTKETVIVCQKVEEIKDFGEPEEIKEVRDTPAAQGADKLANIIESSSDASTYFPKKVKPQHQDVREIYVTKTQVQGDDKLVTCPKSFSITKSYDVDQDPLAEEAPLLMGVNVHDDGTIEERHLHANTEKAIGASDAQHVDNPVLNNSKLNLDLLSDGAVNQICSLSAKHLGNITEPFENLEQDEPSAISGRRKTLESSSASENLFDETSVTTEIENFEMNEFYDEVVHEMEEILLDSICSPGSRLSQVNKLIEPQLSLPLRDGGLTASTSGTDDAYPLVQRPVRIDRTELVGARQKKGDVSFSERLVGVKEYTVYKIKVWSGKDQWEVERRYRDFLTLHRQMKTLFAEQGWILPLPWSSVEKESKNIFGSASPDVVAHRSILIQECLQSILYTRFFSSPPGALIWFLTPQFSYPSSPASNASETQTYFVTRGTDGQNLLTLGKTISLIVEIQPHKSIKELLEAQHYTCAGCHKHFDDGKTLIGDFIRTFGWGKPRLCEYTCQLFCSSCHTNETAVLPARVLHHWDFTKYPVSQLAKYYLDSIYDQPMLCVTAVNPFLLSKVPALLHVMSVRKKIGTMLPYVRCPFRSSINRGLGSRRYLLESNDFFALRDLIDLSKGAFAALPVIVETVSRKILEHITDQCLICCDVGLPCGARQGCSDPSSLIFPFQEDEIKRCKNCQSVFHKPCFRKLGNCPCEAHLRPDEPMHLTNRVSQRGSGETRGTLDLLGRELGSGLSTRLLSGVFSKEKPENTREPKDENIVVMGSLPTTIL